MVRLRPGELVDGRYEVGAVVGQGGMGVVFRALDRTRGVEVALKAVRMDVAEPVDVLRFLRESELVARVDRSGGVARVHAAGRHEGAAFFVMELVVGRDLQALLREGPLDPRRLAAIVESVARTLGACHAANIVHRDVKPGNVLVADDGRPRLVDFGLAKDVERQTRMTATGELAGTPAFMAPEQVEGEGVDGRADVYALGAILYQGLAGRAPFQGAPLALVEQKLIRDPPAPSTIRPEAPRDLEAICVRAMARAPGDRYPTAEALADDLARWSRGEAISIRPARSGKRRLRVVALALATMALLTTTAVGLMTPRRESPAEALEAALDLDRRALVPHAFGLGPGAAPDPRDLRARLDALRAAQPRLSDAHRVAAVAVVARLAGYERHLSGPRDAGPGEGSLGLLVDALRHAEQGQVVEATRRVARVAAQAGPPPELPLVAHRVVLCALERGVHDEGVLALIPLTASSRPRGPRLASLRAAALRATSTIDAWTSSLEEALAKDEALVTVLERLCALLAAGPAAPGDDVRFLRAIWEGLEARAVQAPLERRIRIDAAFRAATAGALSPPPAFIRDLLAASRKVLPVLAGGSSPSPLVVLAALRHGFGLMPGSLWELDQADVDAAAPAGSQAAAFVRFLVAVERARAQQVGGGGDPDLAGSERLYALALAVVGAPVADIAPVFRAQALGGAITGAARVLSFRNDAPVLRQCLASGAELRSLLDVVDLHPDDPTPHLVAPAELRARCSMEGWDDAPALAEWLGADARRRAAIRPAFRPWLGPTLVFLADELVYPPDAVEGRSERLAVVLRFVDEALHLPLDVDTMWLARGLRLKALRKLHRFDEAERAFAPHAAEPWGWLFAIEAVRLASQGRDREAFHARSRRAIRLHPAHEREVQLLPEPR